LEFLDLWACDLIIQILVLTYMGLIRPLTGPIKPDIALVLWGIDANYASFPVVEGFLTASCFTAPMEISEPSEEFLIFGEVYSGFFEFIFEAPNVVEGPCF